MPVVLSGRVEPFRPGPKHLLLVVVIGFHVAVFFLLDNWDLKRSSQQCFRPSGWRQMTPVLPDAYLRASHGGIQYVREPGNRTCRSPRRVPLGAGADSLSQHWPLHQLAECRSNLGQMERLAEYPGRAEV